MFARCALALIALYCWGWLPALLIMLSSVWVVVASMLLRHAGHPRPLAELVGACWREGWQSELVFGYWQPFAEDRVPDHLPDHLPDAAQGRPALLLLHGFHCNRGIWTDWLRWSRDQDVACMALTLEPGDGSIDAYASAIDAAIQQLTAATGHAPVVVAHSMGGLAARAWWRAHGEPGRVAAIVTLGTPHAGTPMAHFASATNARQMRPASPWLKALHEAEAAKPLPTLHCVSANNDQIVFPTSTTHLAGATQLELPATGHLGLVFHAEVRALVARLLGLQASTLNTPRRI